MILTLNSEGNVKFGELCLCSWMRWWRTSLASRHSFRFEYIVIWQLSKNVSSTQKRLMIIISFQESNYKWTKPKMPGSKHRASSVLYTITQEDDVFDSLSIYPLTQDKHFFTKQYVLGTVWRTLVSNVWCEVATSLCISLKVGVSCEK